MVALNWCIVRSRDTHTALVERIGDYVACKEAEYAAWGELWQALTDRHLSPEEFGYLTSYPVPKAEEHPCRPS